MALFHFNRRFKQLKFQMLLTSKGVINFLQKKIQELFRFIQVHYPDDTGSSLNLGTFSVDFAGFKQLKFEILNNEILSYLNYTNRLLCSQLRKITFEILASRHFQNFSLNRKIHSWQKQTWKVNTHLLRIKSNKKKYIIKKFCYHNILTF